MKLYAEKHKCEIVTNFDERYPILADAPLSYQKLIKNEYDRALLSNIVVYGNASFFNKVNSGVSMTQYVNKGTAFGFGENGRSDGNVVIQASPGQDINLADLAEELKALRTEMERGSVSDTPEKGIEIGKVAIAEQAARSGNQAKALEVLKGAGKWTLDVAKTMTSSYLKDILEGKA